MSSPKYVQVMNYLKEECAKKEPHSPIASEREIAQTLGISRMTARHAIEELCSQGYLYREGNKGTFVAQRSKASFPTKEINERRRLLFFDSIYDASNIKEALAALNQQPHDKLIRLVRLVLDEDTPLRVEEIYAAEIDVSDEELGKLNAFLILEPLKENGRVKAALYPQMVPAKYARLLKLKQDMPVIRKDEQIMRADGRPFLFVRTFYNPNTQPYILAD